MLSPPDPATTARDLFAHGIVCFDRGRPILIVGYSDADGLSAVASICEPASQAEMLDRMDLDIDRGLTA